MPALPAELEAQPTEAGSWHLPDPKDTKFTPGEEIEVRPPEDTAPAEERTKAAEPSPSQATTQGLTPEDELLNLVKTMMGDQEVVSAPQSPEDMVALLERIEDGEEGLANTQTGAILALQSLAEERAAIEVERAEEGEVSGTAPTDKMPQGQPSEYVRDMLQQLESEEGSDTAVSSDTAAIDPRVEELARRFQETEDEVRALRQMLREGRISDTDFQAQLRSLMIMDDDQVWWVMGQDDDRWYKFVNNEWTAATPPRLSPSSRTMTFSTDQIIAEDRPATGADRAHDIRIDENNMPLPRQVAVTDPNATVVGSSYLSDVHPSTATTMPTPTLVNPAADATVPIAQPINYGQGTAIPGLGDAAPLEPGTREDAARRAARQNANRALIIAAVGIGLLLALIGGFIWFASNAFYNNIVNDYEPQLAALANFQPEFQTVTLQDYEGRTIATLSQGGNERITVPLDAINPDAIHAVLSLEDPDFYGEGAWGFGETLNAFFVSLTGNSVRNPEPSIAQQVARRFVLGNTNTNQATSSVEELVIAGELSRRYTRNQILELYLNEVFFGNQSYGIEAASRFYFAKNAADLNLPEAALIAGLIADPVTYDPVANREISFARMEEVLARMVAVGCLDMQHGNVGRYCVTQDDREEPRTVLDNAIVRTADYLPRRTTGRYAHFVQLVRQQLEAAFPNLYTTGYVVRTTLVPELQDRAEQAISRALDGSLAGSGATTGAIVVLDPRSGAVRVYVGSHDYNDREQQGENDYARLYHAPGQTIMPMLYAAALDGSDRNGNGVIDANEYLTTASITWDVPGQYPLPDGSALNVPSKNRGVFYGPVPVRSALANGYTGAATDVYQLVGDARFADTANRMGRLFTRTNPQMSWLTAIGETPVRLIDMVAAYGTIANGGTFFPPYTIEAISDRSGNVIEIPDVLRGDGERAISPQVAYLLQSMLSDNASRNPQVYPANHQLAINSLPRQNFVGALDGTSEGARDLWSLGFATNAVTGVWLGRPDGNGVPNQTGLTAAAPIWNEVMSLVTRSQPTNPPREFQNPGSVGPQTICPDTGSPTGQCPSPLRSDLFAAARPPQEAALTASVMVNSWTRQRINGFCPDTQDGVPIVAANISNQNAVAWLRSPQGRPFAQRIGLNENFSSLPIAECDQNTVLPQVNITSPVQGQEVIGNVTVQGQVNAPANFNRYQLEIAPAGAQNFQMLPGFPQQTQQPNPNSILGTWDTTRIPNGQYQLRLSVVAADGGYMNRQVIVNVNNPPPTPTPTPSPTVTPMGIATLPGIVPTTDFGFTPLPFDTPAFGNMGGPTPTFTPDIF
jgi:membrane peptidoglycan carboxypeptidase